MLTADRFIRSGKVRDLYELPDERLLLVASDRISAFDVVLPTEIPDKGRVLTGLSRVWFAETRAIVPNHLLGTDLAAIGDAAGAQASTDDWRGRVMVCQPTTVIPIEAVVRGYLAGSGWAEYRERGTVCGIALPSDLRESDRLPEPIFTPATKAEQGEHDENIDFDSMVGHIERSGIVAAGIAAPLADLIRDRAIALYRHGAAVAAQAGVIVADTKFEFGLVQGRDRSPGDELGRAEDGLMLIDEALTPDSSRFWDAAMYDPGRPQASFDKQFVRDWLLAQAWDKTAPGPELPDDVVAGTRSRYIDAFERITSADFDRYLAEDVIAP